MTSYMEDIASLTPEPFLYNTRPTPAPTAAVEMMSETDFLLSQLVDAPYNFRPSEYPYLHEFYLANRKGKQRAVSPSGSVSSSAAELSSSSAALREQKTVELFLELWINKVGKEEVKEEEKQSSSIAGSKGEVSSSKASAGWKSEEPDSALTSRLEDTSTVPLLSSTPTSSTSFNKAQDLLPVSGRRSLQEASQLTYMLQQDTARAPIASPGLPHALPASMGLPALSTLPPPSAKRGIQIKGRSKLVSRNHVYPVASQTKPAFQENGILPAKKDGIDYASTIPQAVHVSLPKKEDHLASPATPPQAYPSYTRNDSEFQVSQKPNGQGTPSLQISPSSSSSGSSPPKLCRPDSPNSLRMAQSVPPIPPPPLSLSQAHMSGVPDSPTSTHSNSSTEFDNPDAETFFDTQDDEMSRLPAFDPPMKSPLSPDRLPVTPLLPEKQEKKVEVVKPKSSFTLDAYFEERAKPKQVNGSINEMAGNFVREQRRDIKAETASENIAETPFPDLKPTSKGLNGIVHSEYKYRSELLHHRVNPSAIVAESATNTLSKQEVSSTQNLYTPEKSFKASELHDANIQAIQRALALLDSSPPPTVQVEEEIEPLHSSPSTSSKTTLAQTIAKRDSIRSAPLIRKEILPSSPERRETAKKAMEPSYESLIPSHESLIKAETKDMLEYDTSNPHQMHSVHIPSLVRPRPRKWREFELAQTLEDSISTKPTPSIPIGDEDEYDHHFAKYNVIDRKDDSPVLEPDFKIEYEEPPADIKARMQPKEVVKEARQTPAEKEKADVELFARTFADISIKNRPLSPEPEKEQAKLVSASPVQQSSKLASLDPRRYATIESPSPPASPEPERQPPKTRRRQRSSSASSSRSSSSSQDARNTAKNRTSGTSGRYIPVVAPPIRWNGSLAKKSGTGGRGGGNQAERYGTVMSTQTGAIGPRRAWRTFNFGGEGGGQEDVRRMERQGEGTSGISNTDRAWHETRERRGIPHPEPTRYNQDEDEEVLGMATFAQDYRLPAAGQSSFNRTFEAPSTSNNASRHQGPISHLQKPALTDAEIDFFDQIMAESEDVPASSNIRNGARSDFALDEFDRMLNGD